MCREAGSFDSVYYGLLGCHDRSSKVSLACDQPFSVYQKVLSVVCRIEDRKACRDALCGSDRMF